MTEHMTFDATVSFHVKAIPPRFQKPRKTFTSVVIPLTVLRVSESAAPVALETRCGVLSDNLSGPFRYRSYGGRLWLPVQTLSSDGFMPASALADRAARGFIRNHSVGGGVAATPIPIAEVGTRVQWSHEEEAVEEALEVAERTLVIGDVVYMAVNDPTVRAVSKDGQGRQLMAVQFPTEPGEAVAPAGDAQECALDCFGDFLVSQGFSSSSKDRDWVMAGEFEVYQPEALTADPGEFRSRKRQRASLVAEMKRTSNNSGQTWF